MPDCVRRARQSHPKHDRARLDHRTRFDDRERAATHGQPEIARAALRHHGHELVTACAAFKVSSVILAVID